MDNIYKNQPIAGSHDQSASAESLQAKLDSLDAQMVVLNQKVSELDAECKSKQEKIDSLENQNSELSQKVNELEAERKAKLEEPPKTVRWGRIGEFFRAFIIPIFDFIPRLINSFSRYRETSKSLVH